MRKRITLNGKTMWRTGHSGGRIIRNGLENGIRNAVGYSYTCGSTTGGKISPLKRRRRYDA
jgi:hypothetical protein